MKDILSIMKHMNVCYNHGLFIKGYDKPIIIHYLKSPSSIYCEFPSNFSTSYIENYKIENSKNKFVVPVEIMNKWLENYDIDETQSFMYHEEYTFITTDEISQLLICC